MSKPSAWTESKLSSSLLTILSWAANPWSRSWITIRSVATYHHNVRRTTAKPRKSSMKTSLWSLFLKTCQSWLLRIKQKKMTTRRQFSLRFDQPTNYIRDPKRINYFSISISISISRKRTNPIRLKKSPPSNSFSYQQTNKQTHPHIIFKLIIITLKYLIWNQWKK